jgi:hypothetical protein
MRCGPGRTRISRAIEFIHEKPKKARGLFACRNFFSRNILSDRRPQNFDLAEKCREHQQRH